MTSYFLNWLSSSFPLLMLKCPFLSEKLTLLKCFLFLDNQKPSVLLVNPHVHYQWLLPAVCALCVRLCTRRSVATCTCAQFAALTDFTLTSILLSSKLDFYSSVSMLTYLLPFHHLRQGYPEAGSTFMGTRGREGGLEGLALPPAMP